MGRVQGKVAIVSGAAQGIGKAISSMLAREGAIVVVTDINVLKGEAFVHSLMNDGYSAIFIKHDVASDAAWARVIRDTLEQFGRIDILVNNAGVALQKNVEDTTFEEWRHLMSIDLDGVFLGTRHAIGAMKPHKAGSIINISSVEGIVGHPQLAAYNAAKGGVTTFTKSAAIHCGTIGSNIRVNSVHPAFVHNELLDEYLEARDDSDAALRELESEHPIGFLGESDDVAYGVLYLASDESRWVTGSELVIDGGFTAK